jgi:hypothetical protein
MDDVLKTLFTASPGTLLLVAGLLCVVLAVIGGIPGKIELPKGGRPIAGLAGIVLGAAGLWLLSSPTFKVVSATLDTEEVVYGGLDIPCPVDVPVNGLIATSAAGTVGFQLQYSDDQHGDPLTLASTGTVVSFHEVWHVQSPMAAGFAVLKIIVPTGFEAVHTSRPIQVSCRSRDLAAGSSEAPVSAPSPNSAAVSPVNSGSPAGSEKQSDPASGRQPTAPAGAFEGTWLEVSPAGRTPLRWTITQRGNTLTGLPFPFILSDSSTAVYSGIQGCAPRFQRPGFDYQANPSRFTLSLKQSQSSLIYQITTQWNTPCDGHNVGTQQTSYQFRRVPTS